MKTKKLFNGVPTNAKWVSMTNLEMLDEYDCDFCDDTLFSDGMPCPVCESNEQGEAPNETLNGYDHDI